MKFLLRNIRSRSRRAKLLDLNSITRKRVEQTLDQKVKPAIIKSHEMIVANWEHKVKFQARKVITGEKITLYIFPTGENADIWTFVDQGTRPHKIRAKNAPRLAYMKGTYVPKTLARPARTVSGGGRVVGGQLRTPVEVNHPGSEGRHFSQEIAEDIKPTFQTVMNNSFRLIAKDVQELTNG